MSNGVSGRGVSLDGKVPASEIKLAAWDELGHTISIVSFGFSLSRFVSYQFAF